MKKKLYCIFALVMVFSLALCGCSAKDESRVEPTSTPGYMPQGNIVNSAPGTAVPMKAGFDWNTGAAQIEGKIAQISEISEARVVTTGDTALVGVKFDPAYRGEMTERIRQMVAAEVMAADPKITTVAVTADGDDVEDVYEISERSQLGKDLDTLKDDISEIVRNATTLR